MTTSKKKIIIVEDENLIAEAYQSGLTNAGYDVNILYSGIGAFDEIKKDPPDLLLIDLLMPHTNGIDVIKAVKADEITKDIPIIILTNVDSIQIEMQVKSLVVNGYYIKSEHSLKEILQYVDAAINKQ